MSNDTRKAIADAEWASVERDVEVTLREMAGHDIPFATNAENAVTLRAYHDALKARHERELAAYREVAALANRDRANALAERDEERRLRLLAAEHAQGVQAGYQRDLDALRAAVVAHLAALPRCQAAPGFPRVPCVHPLTVWLSTEQYGVCDEHAAPYLHLPHRDDSLAPTVRALVALVARETP